MLKFSMNRRCMVFTVLFVLLAVSQTYGQVQIGGDFMFRAYSEKFFDTRDNRGGLNYMRLLGKLNLDAPIGDLGLFHADLVTISDNPVYPSRSLSGIGPLRYGISQIYGEVTTSDLPLVDLARLRVGRQHYQLGEGLTLGDSYYMLDNYDGVRLDFSYRLWTLGLFGAITKQEVSPSGFYPKPGSDQLYAVKLEYELYNHVLLAYSVYEKQRGYFNDNIIAGIGSNGSIVLKDIKYFGEFAVQRFNTLEGLPEKGGVAYMAGVSYQWTMGPFRLIKAEFRSAGYQGDDASTDKIETFEPYYPNWYWGDRTAYANGSVGGDYPHRGIRPEGSRIWYGRIYFCPAAVPEVRLQFQYADVGDWINNDNITEPNDEFGIKLYYDVNANVLFQARYFRRITNSDDLDVNQSDTITLSEDKFGAQRIMLGFEIRF